MISDSKLDVEFLCEVSEHEIPEGKHPPINYQEEIGFKTLGLTIKPEKNKRVQKSLTSKSKLELLVDVSVERSSSDYLYNIAHRTIARTAKPIKRGRIQKAKTAKVQPLAKKLKMTELKKATKTSSRKLGSRSKAQKKLSPTLSQYSGESEYENPERENLSYFS
ncbi:hypothetical protein HNY73_018556 [Argiope bruennichi]|uniref:Uncharacterized protein n=1 Tax=Argiope bruennichi TaxID=94029 RepID=A0A8T0EDA1_ARGBR|nr:hypothetical protein HNY73_018556 [Argiope bruennichi]